ncbi:MAG: ATPase, T2SS/T4P/T4SS family, partial [Promethearchaeota archaeon]
IEYVLKNINSTIRFEKIVPIEGLIKVYSKEIEHYLNLKFNLSKKENKRLSFIITLKKLNLIKLFPFLIDDYVEEIFLDSPKDKVYLNHQKYGRCKTSISFNNKEIERLKTLIRLYSGQRLDFSNPSIKHVIKNKYFYCRFAIDVEPINLNEFSLDIRKLNKNILTIQDLLKNKTIYPLMAAFLYFNILRRVNITVTGETDSGKTTFINALDLLVPKEFRKIYIENVIESLNELEYDKHQLKFKVNSLEELENIKYSKSNQIKKLLHRTPDIIYLGEILTKEEAEAMFHCLAAGLRGFQTIHANNIESLLNRFLYHFKINESCLTDLDLIVLMKKNNNKRRVFSISEICIEKSQNGYNQIIFQYNPESKRWDINTSLYKTKTIENLKKFEKLSKEKFFAYINIYNDIFEYISKINNLDNIILVDFFHKVSYYSLKSLKKLSNFWNNIRKNSTLNL